MAQESQASYVEQDGGGPTLGAPGDQPEEGKSHSLLSKVREKAKGTVQKLTSKGKRGCDDSTEDVSSATSGGQHREEPTNDDSEELSASDSQKETQGGRQIAGIDGLQEIPNGSEQRVSFGIKPEDDRLRPFARSEAAKDPLTATPLIATPTSYGGPHTTVEDVMPPSIIAPTSASELGEESSSSLGNIPEARDEEKAAAQEVATGGPDADINEGFKETFQQKDLQAIDGLPKPRGFDVGNGDRVDSGDLGFQRNQAFEDQTLAREMEGNAEGVANGANREFPVDGAAQSRGIEQDNGQPHPPGSVAEFTDSMFTSHATHDLKPNEPIAAEAKRAGEIGVFSRDFDSQREKSSGTEGDKQHPPGSTAEFTDSMFSSGATHDMKPNRPNAAEAKHAGEIGTLSRGVDPEANKSVSRQGNAESLQHPPAAESELHENRFSSDIASGLKPSQTDQESFADTNSEGAAPSGDLAREGVSEGNANVPDPPKVLPQPALAGDLEDSRQIDDSSAGTDASFDQGNSPVTDEEEAENYFDDVSDDDVLASQRSLDSDISKDFNPDATDEYNKQTNYLTESANVRVKAAINDEIEASNRHSASNSTVGTSTLVSTLTSVVDSVGSKVGLITRPQNSSSQSQANTVHSTTSDKVSGWISIAIGVVLTDEQEDGRSETGAD